MENKETPRGIRNNNPLNIRYSASNDWVGRVNIKNDPDFEEFTLPSYGYRAAFILLRKYIYVYCCKNIGQIIARWAPAADGNNPGHYAETVARLMRRDVHDAVAFEDAGTMLLLAAAMTMVECGVKPNVMELYVGYTIACRAMGVEVNIPGLEYVKKLIEQCILK